MSEIRELSEAISTELIREDGYPEHVLLRVLQKIRVQKNSKKLQEELDKLKRSGIRVHYYYSFDKSKIYKL